MSTKDSAIAVYLENKEHLICEFEVLYESFIASRLGKRFDILLFHPPNSLIETKYNKTPHIILSPCRSISEDKLSSFCGYHYINSINALATDHAKELFTNYKYILKTDCDVVLSPRLRHFYPEFMTVGYGAYCHDDVTREKLATLAAEHSINRQQDNIGATWMGDSTKVHLACVESMKFATEIWNKWFDNGKFEGKWPSLYRGVTTMYAGELAIQSVCDQILKSDMLDASCTNGRVKSMYNAHMWHTEDDFSKHKWHRGEYDHLFGYYEEMDLNEQIAHPNAIPSYTREYIFVLITRAKQRWSK